jgi:beta-galactosidase
MINARPKLAPAEELEMSHDPIRQGAPWTANRRAALAMGLTTAGLAATVRRWRPRPRGGGKKGRTRAGCRRLARRRVRLAEGWRSPWPRRRHGQDFDYGQWQRTYAKPGLDGSPATLATFDDRDWTPVRVPHDWAVELPYAAPIGSVPKDEEDPAAAHGFRAIGRDYPENSVGWYRLALPISEAGISKADKGRAVWLEFDGVFRNCKVFVNGYEAGAVPRAMRRSAWTSPISSTPMAGPTSLPCASTPALAKAGSMKVPASIAMSIW